MLACDSSYETVVQFMLSNAPDKCNLYNLNTICDYPLLAVCKNNMDQAGIQILEIHKKMDISTLHEKNLLRKIYKKCITHCIKHNLEYVLLEFIKLIPDLTLSISPIINKDLYNKIYDILDELGSPHKLQFMLDNNEFEKVSSLDDAKIIINYLMDKENNQTKLMQTKSQDCIICASSTDLSYINYECFHIFFTCDECREGFEQLDNCPSCREKFFPRRCYLPE